MLNILEIFFSGMNAPPTYVYEYTRWKFHVHSNIVTGQISLCLVDEADRVDYVLADYNNRLHADVLSDHLFRVEHITYALHSDNHFVRSVRLHRERETNRASNRDLLPYYLSNRR